MITQLLDSIHSSFLQLDRQARAFTLLFLFHLMEKEGKEIPVSEVAYAIGHSSYYKSRDLLKDLGLITIQERHGKKLDISLTEHGQTVGNVLQSLNTSFSS